MNKIHTHIVMSLVILGSSYFLYMIYLIVCTYLWSSLSLFAQRSSAELLLTYMMMETDFGKCHEKKKLYPQHVGMLNRGEMKI